MSTPSTLSLAGAAIVVPGQAPPTVRLAAGELARYLYLLTGKVSPVVEALPARAPAVVLDRRLCQELGVAPPAAGGAEQGYRLARPQRGREYVLCVAAPRPVGVLHGVYGLLELLGMGFYAGGDTFPETPTTAEIPRGLDRQEQPVFAVRGNMLHYNFLCGPTDWGLKDYQFYFDQLARMRCNMLLMHWYDSEPGAAYEVGGEYRAGGVTPNALSRPWGALAALRCSEFSFDTGRYFGQELFTAPMGEDFPDLLTEVKRTEQVFREATGYARRYGIEVAAGFEAPRGDPTDPQELEHFRSRLRQFLDRNPDISRFALWQHESGGCFGSQPPGPGTLAGELHASQHELFAYLGTERRVWEAIRFGEFARIAAKLVEREYPRLRMVVVGWGGDRWMRFADYCLAYDKLLPPFVAFTCHDNIDASFGDSVSAAWGELPPERERWAMPWVEGDIDDCWVRQPHVESLGKLTPDALAKGCHGMLTLQWRTRDVEEETGFVARFAWDPELTPDRFYRDLARHQFGPDQEERMGAHLATLQRLGARWTGVRGCAECSRMRWTGWVPHIPWEVTEAAEFLLPKARKAAEMLSEVPPEGEEAEAGAFHLRSAQDRVEGIEHDPTRPGVRELREAARRLQTLRAETSEARIRRELREIEEEVFRLREELVAYGMSTRSYQGLDAFLIQLHQLQRNAGVKRHMATLRRIRKNLAALREQYLSERRTARLERLDFLAATMDFVMNFDSTVLLVADGELADQARAEAARLAKAGKTREAKEVAAAAYAQVVEAGMQAAMEAYTRKLTTRCDFGVLATLNVKPLPLYWQTLEGLEEHMGAVPPREVRARGQRAEVWVSWEPVRAVAQHLYRRRAGRGRWQRVNRDPLAADCRMFVDRPEPGIYDYAVTALDEQGWESPRSHLGHAVCGRLSVGPELVANKPPSFQLAGQDLELKVVALSPREVAGVEIAYRRAGEPQWLRAPMTRCFRDSYRGSLPGAALVVGVVEFRVEATDEDGNRSQWPARGQWSLTVGR